RKCLKVVLSDQNVRETREQFLKKGLKKQGEWLLNFFEISQRVQNGKSTFDYYVQKKKVCQKAWLTSHGISNGRFTSLLLAVKTSTRLSSRVHARKGTTFESRRFIEAELWFGDMVDSLANRMPDLSKRELPACLTFQKIYEMYTESVQNPLKPSQFRRMRLNKFPDVIIPKRNRFTKCGVCLLITEHIRATTDKKKRVTWTERKQLHMEQQAGERKKYYKHQKKAEQRPDKYLSLIIDGMDQSKTHLPHWIQKSKLEGECDGFLKTHVTGVLSHGHKKAWCFIDFMRWPQDANPTINCLISVFRHLRRTKIRLPPTLYLQLDNCYRDCKNIHILGFCALLVKAGVFRKVRLSYLMVGHTHEDIDQMFSRISVALARTNAVTLDDLIQVIRGAYNPTPITCSVENIYDVKTWLRPFVPSLKHHSNPHAFRFKMNENGEVEMSYRPFAKSGRKQWLPEEGPIVLLKQVPPGKPSVIKPDMKKCPSVEVIKDSVEKLGVRMSSAQLDWWRKMAEDEERKRRQWESLTPDQYRKAGESFDLLEFKYQNEDPDPDEDGEYGERNKKLLRLIEKKENHLP
ncbi:unnamed protein product, partial [Porites evermanni]